MNDRIRIPEVRVIAADGSMLGVLPTHEARRLAEQSELDLVEVNPKAVPPVCKIMDFGKFKYEEKKRQAEAKKKQSQVELKEIKLRPKTDDHDIAFKVKHIQRFLEDGNKVKLTVRFRGREITHPEMARRQIELIIDAVKDLALVESANRMEGRTMTALLAPRGPKIERKGRDMRPALAPLTDQDDDDDEDEDEDEDEDDDTESED
ncbi:MAG: translation initiation factor IF-3 [Sandaracinus sp.]|nr:translation initiation factor IF-3 [Sandaracinus sp.]MCB9616443.1 translation initiation factor IF-3 [Sandaracinus sp.]MCB9618933.1 translation initiation factor IF-3 [Sandaracinus sp.]